MNSLVTYIHPLFAQGYGSADFEVKKRPLYYKHDLTFDGSERTVKTDKYAIVRDNNSKVLGYCGANYQLVEHKDMIDNQRQIIARSGLDIEGIEERIVTDASGSKCYITHVLPKHEITTPDGDTAHLSFLGVNSYDGTFAFILSVGARQSACMNGQVFTSGASTIYKARHSRKLNIQHAAAVVGNSVKILENEQHLWHEWHNTSLSNDKAIDLIKDIAGMDKDKIYYSLHEMQRNNTFNYLFLAWHRYQRKLGQNKWAFYNALTDWSTHSNAGRESAQANIASIRAKRADKVQKFLNKMAA